MEKGMEKGIMQGITQGETNARVDIAKDMKRNGYAPEVISRLCKLTLEQISAL